MTIGLWLLLLAVLIAMAWWWWSRRALPVPGGTADASAAAVHPKTVMLPPADAEEKPRIRKRTGETQELKRRIVHGPFQAIGDKGAATSVAPGKADLERK